MNFLRRFLLAAACALPFAAPAGAQTFPARPVKILVPFVPGGGADAVARMVSSQLQQKLGQPVVVENKPGAGGAIAGAEVARAASDGHTLLIVTNTFLTNAAIAKTPYDPLRDFTPITTLGTSPYLLLVNAGSEWKTMADLVKYAKANPTKVSYGSAGVGGITHLLGELFRLRGGVPAQHVPYKGSAAALTDLLGNQIQFAFADTASAIQHVKAGKLRALAITAPDRSPLLPDVPTTAEAGVKVEVVGFYGLLAPAKLPPAVLARLNADMGAVLQAAEVKERFAATLTDAVAMPPDQFAKMFANEAALWTDVVKKSGSKFE